MAEKLPEKIRKGLATKAAIEGITATWRSWIWPTVSPLVVAALGILEGIPLMYVAGWSALTFAAVATGLVRISEWRFARSADGKLVFAGPYTLSAIDKATSEVNAISLGFTVANKASFPIKMEVISIRTRLDNRVNPDPKISKRVFEVSAGGSLYFYDDGIDLSDVDLDDTTLFGSVEFEVHYGAGENRPYVLRKAFTLERRFTARRLEPDGHWFETN